MEGFREIQVPPADGKNVVVLPIQILFGPLRDISGLDWTLITLVKTVSQPVANSMNLKLALPWLSAVTKPEPEIDAIAGVNEVQIPPTVGLN